MTTPQPGDRFVFRLTPLLFEGVTPDDYIRHNGQVVTVTKSYDLPKGEPTSKAFYVRADDGWLGAVFADELKEITA